MRSGYCSLSCADGSISRGESIADHMYRMSLISMFAPPSLAPRLDLPKCMKMCLIHDMAELLVGDITPVDGVAKPEKNRREAAILFSVSLISFCNCWKFWFALRSG